MLKVLVLLLISAPLVHAFSKKNIVKDCKEKSEGPCYEFPGRARIYGNNKWVRIWKKGSKRLYNVARYTESAYSDLKHLSMATEIHADYDVCFLKPEVPSGYSDICITSVKKAITTNVPE